MSVYLCVSCEQHYCVDCDSGEDSCSKCSTGPRCLDCAFEHEVEHKDEDREGAEDATTDGPSELGRPKGRRERGESGG